MVAEVVMTAWIRLVQGSETVKDQDVDEARGKSEGVYSKGMAMMTVTNELHDSVPSLPGVLLQRPPTFSQRPSSLASVVEFGTLGVV